MAVFHSGACFCGAVEIRAEGTPLEMGYCHCTSCRTYSGGPMSGYVLWPQDKVVLSRGAGHLGRFNKSGMSERRHCLQCGGHVLTEHPGLGLTDVRPGILRDFAFAPSVHIHYAEAVLPVRDGLPKLRDFPSEAGGSGELMPE